MKRECGLWVGAWLIMGACHAWGAPVVDDGVDDGVGANTEKSATYELFNTRAIAHSDAWLSLLYYRKTWHGYESEADDPAFFLSPKGPTSPVAELRASLQAFAQDQPHDDSHAQCRFPARYYWLKQQTGSPLAGVADQSCAAFTAFQTRVVAHSVTMVYPVPNMDDVSTLFGHSFLRFDRDPAPAVDKSEDYTLNFAALLKKGTTQSDLVTKGLTGPLDGIYTVLPYKKKLQDYLQMEARDIWEYRLNLTQPETDQLVRHAWEMHTAHFEYKFFVENCSYRMLNFLDVARPGLNLHQQYSFYVIPMDAVETVIGAGLVNNVHYQPSDVSRWSAVADTLSDEERQQFHDGTLPASRMGAPDDVPKPLQPGDVGHYSGRVTLAAGVREGLGVASFSARPAYHDFLDAPSGGPLAEITVLELDARQIEQHTAELTDLTLFAASSIKVRDSLYSPWSWRLSSGVTGLRWLEPDTALAPRVAGEPRAQAYQAALNQADWINPLYVRMVVGPAWGGRDIAFYQLVGAELQVDQAFDGGGAALALWNPGIVLRSEQWQAQLEAMLRQPTDGNRDTYGQASASITRKLSVESMLFLRALREKDVLGTQDEVQLGAGFYF